MLYPYTGWYHAFWGIQHPESCALNISSTPRLPQLCDDPGSSLRLCWDYGNLAEWVGQDCLILHISLISYLVLMPVGLSWKKYVFCSSDFSFSDMKIILFNQILRVHLKNLPFPMLFTAGVVKSDSSWLCRKPTGIKGTWWAWLLSGVCMSVGPEGAVLSPCCCCVGTWAQSCCHIFYFFQEKLKVHALYLISQFKKKKMLATNSIEV